MSETQIDPAATYVASTCRECSATLVPSRAWRTLSPEERAERRAKGYDVRSGRGLCNRCYGLLWYRGDLIDVPRITVPIADVLEAWERDDHRPGESRKSRCRRLTPRLGMTPNALERALLRAGVAS